MAKIKKNKNSKATLEEGLQIAAELLTAWDGKIELDEASEIKLNLAYEKLGPYSSSLGRKGDIRAVFSMAELALCEASYHFHEARTQGADFEADWARISAQDAETYFQETIAWPGIEKDARYYDAMAGLGQSMNIQRLAGGADRRKEAQKYIDIAVEGGSLNGMIHAAAMKLGGTVSTEAATAAEALVGRIESTEEGLTNQQARLMQRIKTELGSAKSNFQVAKDGGHIIVPSLDPGQVILDVVQEPGDLLDSLLMMVGGGLNPKKPEHVGGPGGMKSAVEKMRRDVMAAHGQARVIVTLGKLSVT